jgi:hypothetical protein
MFKNWHSIGDTAAMVTTGAFISHLTFKDWISLIIEIATFILFIYAKFFQPRNKNKEEN